jgi:monolysocardiolipin acyltransferase
MTQAVRLLSAPSAAMQSDSLSTASSASSIEIPDPFSSAQLTYSTNGIDTHPAPSAYPSRKHAWIHIFPEGRIHQHPHYVMRYFRWGVARLILEADECPDIVPIWIEGCEQIMHEERSIPRFLPRFGKRVGIWFGENVAGAKTDSAFVELRRRWQNLVTREERGEGGQPLPLGVLSEELKYGREAVELRKECTFAVRRAVLELRRQRSLPDEDPKAGVMETWIEEGSGQGRMRDGSIVREE